MTDNEIIKALECHSNDYSFCMECPFSQRGECSCELARNALDLINRKNAEIERFKKIETTVNGFWGELQKLAMFKDKETPTLEELLEYIENLKVEEVKEFAERLKTEAKLRNHTNYGANKQAVSYNEGVIETRKFMLVCIDNLVKEMVGEG